MSRYDDTMIEHNGEALSVEAWSKRLGIASVTLWGRLFRYRWTTERALTEPLAVQDWQQGPGTIGERLTRYRWRNARD